MSLLYASIIHAITAKEPWPEVSATPGRRIRGNDDGKWMIGPWPWGLERERKRGLERERERERECMDEREREIEWVRERRGQREEERATKASPRITMEVVEG